MLIADAGSTWCKLYDAERGAREVFPTQLLRTRNPAFAIATGHSAKPYSRRFENELLALAEGSRSLVGDEMEYTVVDVGSRDIKYVKFHKGKAANIDWTTGCASSTGATIEMLARFYNLDFSTIELSESYINVTCGTFGLEKIMDMVAAGESASLAVSMFVHGLVRNILNFLSYPEKLYLSGGFCENPLFTGYLAKYCDPFPLGRFVLIEGLCSIANVKPASRNEREKMQ
ncbi:MAG: hypothetical protein Kow0090_14940 [Myxococcota bacterium]